jgi:predicted Zn-dependent protease
MKKTLMNPRFRPSPSKRKGGSCVPTHRRLEYAHGYILLGMLRKAADELRALEADDRSEPKVMDLLMDLYLGSEQWSRLAVIARQHTEMWPGVEQGWVMWAHALRSVGRLADARAVLQRGAPLLEAPGAALHYQLACCNSLLGEPAEARRELELSLQIDGSMRVKALTDADLKGLWA